MQVALSNKQTVTLRDKFTRAADRAYDDVVYVDAVYGRNDDGARVIQNIPPQNAAKACEAALPHMIEKITDENGTVVSFTQTWLDFLVADDFNLIMKAFLDIKNGNEEEGKKNTADNSENGGGVDAGKEPSGA